VTGEWDPDNVMDVLGNEYARQILALAERTHSAQPTVSRRVNTLLEYDLLKERVSVDEEGHHYKTFETTFERATFAVDDGDIEIEVEIERDLFDAEDDDSDALERDEELTED